jgi:hypothetical protein
MMSRGVTTIAALCAMTLVAVPSAHAAWSPPGTGSQTAKARTMPTGSTPTASVSNRNVTVSWTQATIGGSPVQGYLVKRYDTNGNVQTIGAGCSGLVTAVSCTETAVPAGSWTYSVTPKQQNWLGTESARSSAVTVAAPALSFSGSTTVTSLPASLTGTIANYIPAQTVTYRLDDPTTGTLLSGSISPSPVPSSGSATVSVTIPSGTANGAHTVYAIGSSGDVASAAITVAVPITITTSAWDVRDASAGAGEVNQTALTAAADGLTFPTGTWASTFGTKYAEVNLNGPLPSGQTVSGASFNFRFAAAASGETACFYFETRRISTGAVIGTHGSPSSPVGCVTGTSLQTFTTAIPEVNTSALADDVRIRFYASESAAKAITVDLATVTGTAASTSFTLYTGSYTDATGTPTTSAWGLFAAGDGFAYTSAANWAASFSTSRYLKLTFPAYVPSGVTVTGATLKNYYRPTSSGRNVCWYFEVYAGATLIGTHGSSSSPVSCNSTTAYTTDSIPLPEVDTVAEANSIVIKAYYDISGTGTRTTQHDLATLSVTYT